MKKQAVSLLVLLLMAFATLAQDSVVTIVSKNRYLNLDFGIGYLHTDLGHINGFLSSYGFKPVQEDIITLSFSPSFFVNRFVFRGEYTWQFPISMPQAENVNSSFHGRHVAISIGYLLIQKPGFRLYPYVGINSFTSHLVVREKTSVSNLDQLVNNQQRGFQLGYSNASLDVGFQIDKLFSLKTEDGTAHKIHVI